VVCGWNEGMASRENPEKNRNEKRGGRSSGTKRSNTADDGRWGTNR
jgi:hypothetical protein